MKRIYFVFLFCISGIHSIAQEQNNQINSYSTDSYSIDISKTNVQSNGYSMGKDFFTIKGNLNYIFKYLHTSNNSFFFDDPSKYIMKVKFNKTKEEFSFKDVENIFHRLASNNNCNISIKTDSIQAFETIINNEFKSTDFKINSNSGITKKIQEDIYFWVGYKVTIADITNYLEKYYGKIIVTNTESQFFDIKLDKKKSFVEISKHLKDNFGITLVETEIEKLFFQARNCNM